MRPFKSQAGYRVEPVNSGSFDSDQVLQQTKSTPVNGMLMGALLSDNHGAGEVQVIRANQQRHQGLPSRSRGIDPVPDQQGVFITVQTGVGGYKVEFGIRILSG